LPELGGLIEGQFLVAALNFVERFRPVVDLLL
jgi:hypothetical protein